MRVWLWVCGAEAVVEIRRIGCATLNYCNGHGRCVSATEGSPSESCACFEGWGGAADVAIDHMLDCSQRTCPRGVAASDMPTTATEAHAVRECSNNGLCDRLTGNCECFDSWQGTACERRGCPNDCSGHGQCMSMAELATRDDAIPLSIGETNNATTGSSYREWDAALLVGCLCDSSWPVGLGRGERQDPEWFGPDCSLRRCPSGDDPMTAIDDTDCTNKTAAGGKGVGLPGNLCHVECSNRGVCNTRSGECSCFPGYGGVACDKFASQL